MATSLWVWRWVGEEAPNQLMGWLIVPGKRKGQRKREEWAPNLENGREWGAKMQEEEEKEMQKMEFGGGGEEGPNGGGRGRRRNYGHREADRVPGETLESQGPRLNSKATFGNLFVAKMVARTGHKKAKDPSEWINSIKYDWFGIIKLCCLSNFYIIFAICQIDEL